MYKNAWARPREDFPTVPVRSNEGVIVGEERGWEGGINNGPGPGHHRRQHGTDETIEWIRREREKRDAITAKLREARLRNKGK